MTQPSLHIYDLDGRKVLFDREALISTEAGDRFKRTLNEIMMTMLPGELLRLSFEGVCLMDAAFADASLVALALDFAKGKWPERYLLVEGLSKAALQNVSLAAESRHVREVGKLRNLALPILTPAGEVDVLGKLEPALSEALAIVRRLPECTSRQLAEELELRVEAASTKLKTLYGLRLLRRREVVDEVGKQFLYRFFV